MRRKFISFVALSSLLSSWAIFASLSHIDAIEMGNPKIVTLRIEGMT